VAGAVQIPRPPIWWSNASFVVLTHIAALYGILVVSPPHTTPWKSLILFLALYELSFFGITVGYHRLYSHQAFKAHAGVKIILAILGSMGSQGSIKWWVIRHRLHHRFTDDPIHDPYPISRGLFFAHMGWILYKPSYPRLSDVDKSDLEKDPIVRFQHRHYVPIALFFGFIMPYLIGLMWGDPLGAFIWGGLLARVFTWHCTFIVNSLAHWEGLQKFTDECSAKGNWLMAFFTCGEGNHNFHHAFPYDYRSGPDSLDLDPSKWLILLLERIKLVYQVKRARVEDIEFAKDYMRRLHDKKVPEMEQPNSEEIIPWTGPMWTRSAIEEHVRKFPTGCFIILDDYFVDASSYMGSHPGGARLLRTYSLRFDRQRKEVLWQDATWPFENFNYHGRFARRRLRELAIGKVSHQ